MAQQWAIFYFCVFVKQIPQMVSLLYPSGGYILVALGYDDGIEFIRGKLCGGLKSGLGIVRPWL